MTRLLMTHCPCLIAHYSSLVTRGRSTPQGRERKRGRMHMHRHWLIRAIVWALVWLMIAPPALLAQGLGGLPGQQTTEPQTPRPQFPVPQISGQQTFPLQEQPIITNPTALQPLSPHQFPCPPQPIERPQLAVQQGTGPTTRGPGGARATEYSTARGGSAVWLPRKRAAGNSSGRGWTAACSASGTGSTAFPAGDTGTDVCFAV